MIRNTLTCFREKSRREMLRGLGALAMIIREKLEVELLLEYESLKKNQWKKCYSPKSYAKLNEELREIK